MRWSARRAKDQHELVTELFRRGRDVPGERAAVMAGGLRGADKDAVLAAADVDRSRYLAVSVDGVLAEMAARGLISPLAGQSPLAAADQVHEEAQYLAKRVALLALADGTNLLLDMSLASARSAEAWMYALRVAGYAVTAVFADITIEEAGRRSDAAHRRGEEAYRGGRGHGGRYVPPEAIRALAGPAAAEARDRIRWASGARASVLPPDPAGGPFAGSAVSKMILSYRVGQLTLDDLGLEFRARRWPAVPSVCPPGLGPAAAAAIDDPEPYVPGSLDDLVLAYDLGQLTDQEYESLAEAAS